MFSKKGQSALEYLMTYGWALIVIVIVIGALMLLVGDPSSGGVSCSPTGGSFVYEDLSYDGTDLQLVLTNGSGSNMSDAAVNVAAPITVDVNNSGSWVAGTKETFTLAGITTDIDSANQVILTITWTAASGLSHSETKTCTVE